MTCFCKVSVWLNSLLTIVVFIAHAQTGTITGTVRDAATGEGLPYANVFINNSSLGTASDPSGKFTISSVTPGTVELITSYIGYAQSTQRVNVKAGETLTLVIQLTEDSGQLIEVEVKGTRDKTWEKQLRQFEKVFLGDNDFARQCTIKNPWVLDFNETKADGTTIVTATASQPIVIENLALGYTVTYYLRSFLATTDAYSIQGEIRFQELQTTDQKQASMWEQNRTNAYLGSYRHLFKSLIEGRASEEGFSLYYHAAGTAIRDSQNQTFSSQINQNIHAFTTTDIVQPQGNTAEYRIKLFPQIEVHYNRSFAQTRVYRDISFPVSWLELRRGYVDVNREGIVTNANDLVVSGAMNNARVAHLLPNNYQPGDALRASQVSSLYSSQKMRRLQEKVYIQTDRPYYYPGETIWWKAYLNYQSPELLDSLSRVLYVELINPENEIAFSGTWPIQSGTAQGALQLPALLSPGQYSLRSYTRWMMNYKASGFFYKSIPVLNDFQRPAYSAAEQLLTADSSLLIIMTDKPVYQPREKIHVSIAWASEAENFPGADLSVVVNDLSQVVPVPEMHTILTGFVFDETTLPESHEVKHPIEFGISLQGQHVNAKGKPARTNLLMAPENLQQAFLVDTDDRGNFWVSGLRFTDSVSIGFQYINNVKKPGRILLTPRPVPPVIPAEKQVVFNIHEETTPQRKRSIPESFDKAIVLDEVITSSSSLETSQPVVTKGNYGKPDYTITGQALRSANAFSLVDALRASVPGLNVVYSSGTQTIRFGGPSNFLGAITNEPLLIIDGIQMNNQGGLTVYDQLFQVNPLQVERVEVIKNGGAAIYGSRGANGVIIVVTKDRHTPAVTPNNPTVRHDFFQQITLKGYTAPVIFPVPDYSKPDSLSGKILDNRPTVYWNPSVALDASGKAEVSFYATDLAGTYRIMIEGVTHDNIPLRATGYIIVKP